MGFSKYRKDMKYRGFKYTSLRKESKNSLQKVYNYLEYNRRLKIFLKSYLLQKKIDAILIADLPLNSIRWLKKFCIKNNIQFLVDSVEWYSPEQFKYGNFSLAMILKNIENKYILDKNAKIISISKYLNNYFGSKGCNTIRIPVILDVKNIPFLKHIKENKLTILYAGSPGKKDYLNEMLRGLIYLNEEERNRIRFIVAGVSFDQIKSWFTSKELMILNSCVEFLGRVERNVVLNTLSEVDFTVLLRESDLRYAKAGFPTKVVESLATGTPVILNLSSDLGEYINDMQEGLIVKDCSAEAFAQTLIRAQQLEKSQKEAMRYKARICAENNFDYRLYKERLSDLLIN
jgi:glycosyltransferase involved in cell wall biosynthesis